MLKELGSTAEGLTQVEADKRLAENGKNKLDAAPGKSLIRRFLEQLADPMIIILLAAAAISGVLAVVENEGFTDEEIGDELVKALSCGATLGDVPGSLFDAESGMGVGLELTYKQEAIDKQMELIDRIHSMGKEALMSSHTLKFEPAETVLKIALEQQRRGADIVKIVTGANSDEEQMENLRITTLLKKELKVPFLFLSAGTHSKIHRMVGPQLGCVTYLAVREHDSAAVSTQPTIRAAKAVRDNFDYLPDIADVYEG